MNQVSNEIELRQALSNQIAAIEIIDSFTIANQVNILYDVTITSAAGNVFTLTKDSTYFGYLFRISDNGILTLSNIIIDGDATNHPIDNTANRSLLYITGGTLNVETGTIIQNNNAYGDGGGILSYGSLTYVNTMNIRDNAIIQNNYSRTYGGGIACTYRNVNDRTTITDSVKIYQNQAETGGGICFRSLEIGAGEAINIGNNVVIDENRAASTGGGIAIINIANSEKPMFLTLTGTTSITNNIAINGGAIYYSGTAPGEGVHITNTVTITDNTATQYGGAIYYANSNQSNLEINGSILRNHAQYGGAFYLNSIGSGTALLDGATVSDNIATSTGGAIYFVNENAVNLFSVDVRNSHFERNVATTNGGAIYYSGNTGSAVTLTESIFDSNQAINGSGGAMTITNTGSMSFQVFQTIFTNNRCGNMGGAIVYTNNSNEASMNHILNGSFINNYAEYQGGAIRMNSGGVALETVLESSTFVRNQCNTNSGGALWFGEDSQRVLLNGTTILDYNETNIGNGGAIYFNSKNGTLSLQDDVKITNNLANRVFSDWGNHGGGISVVPGNIDISGNVEIANNQASQYGGGISITGNSKLDMTGGSIHDNVTNGLGGGIYNKESTVHLQEGSIYQNSADIGGGVWNGNESNNS